MEMMYFVLDIEECATEKDNCHADANCTNTKGSFFCTCHTGFSGDGVMCIGMQLTFVKFKFLKPFYFSRKSTGYKKARAL